MSATNGTAAKSPITKRLLANPTSTYQPNSWTMFGGLTSSVLDGKPFFTWWDIPRMLRDPRVRFLERMWRSPFQQAKWKVKAEDERVGRYVDATLRKFWRGSLPKMLSRYFRFGFAPGGAEFGVRKGAVRLERVKAIEPNDARPLVYTATNKAAGFTVKTNSALEGGPATSGQLRILCPHAMWFAGYNEFGPFYDMPPLAGMFEPWLEKRGRNGAIDSRRTWFRKGAADGGTMRHPEGISNYGTDENPQMRDNADVAREVLDYAEVHTVYVMSNQAHPVIPGKYAWEREPAVARGDIAGFREYPQDLDAEMAAGIGIPTEVFEAADVGSGWSGRMIPLMAWLGSVDEMVGMAIESADSWLRYAVMGNFGTEVYYEVEPQSLVEQMREQAQAGKGGGEGENPVPQLMGQPPQPGQPPRQPPQPGRDSRTQAMRRPVAMSDGRGSPIPPEVARRVRKILRRARRRERAHELSWARYDGPHGGKGWKNAETGEIRYQQDKPADIGDGTDTPEGGTGGGWSAKLYKRATARAARIVAAVGQLPGAAVRKARAKVAATYGKLESRYGKGYARAIVAAGLTGLPIPVPGASVAMAAPVLAVAELHRRLRKQPDTGEALEPKTVKSGARWFMGRVLGRAAMAMGHWDGRAVEMSMATLHAPKGGAVVAGKKFVGGEFIPDKVLAKATPQEKAKLVQKGKPGAKVPENKATKPPVPAAKKDDLQPPKEVASPREWLAARKRAEAQIADAPVPTEEQMKKVRGKLDAWKAACKTARAKGERVPKLREYYDARGGGAAHKARAKRIFEAHGGAEKGYVVCHGTGRKMHWTDDPELNPNGYPKFEQGKIFVAAQGGDYRDANVLPEHPSYNRLRGNAPLRSENLPDIDRYQGDAPASGGATHTDAAAIETAKKWVGEELPEEMRAAYAHHLGAVLSRMPNPARKLAEGAIGKGGATFHPDAKSVSAAASAITGKRESGTTGFVRHKPGGAIELHVDGGTDPAGLYAHELWHAVDSDRYYSDQPAWQKAWKSDIIKGRTLLSRYAREAPVEGFAEFGRLVHAKGPEYARATYPNCWKFLESQGLT